MSGMALSVAARFLRELAGEEPGVTPYATPHERVLRALDKNAKEKHALDCLAILVFMDETNSLVLDVPEGSEPPLGGTRLYGTWWCCPRSPSL